MIFLVNVSFFNLLFMQYFFLFIYYRLIFISLSMQSKSNYYLGEFIFSVVIKKSSIMSLLRLMLYLERSYLLRLFKLQRIYADFSFLRVALIFCRMALSYDLVRCLLRIASYDFLSLKFIALMSSSLSMEVLVSIIQIAELYIFYFSNKPKSWYK